MEATDEIDRLLEAAGDDEASRRMAERALLARDVHVLGSADTGSELQVYTVWDDEGPALALFTSRAAVSDALVARPDLDRHGFRVPCVLFFERTRGNRVIVNPHGAHPLVLSAARIEELLAES